MSLTADDVYQAVKAIEESFPLPAPYFTVDVGTLNVATGVFNGLSTDTTVEREPVEHGSGEHPHNRPPHFVENIRVSESINAQFRRTITIEPAPHVPLAPVLVKFSVTNAATAWTVRVNGADTSVRAGRSSVLVDVWDAEAARWRITIGSRVHEDIVWFQRPQGPHPAALGAFTIPVLPLTIVYAPPVDSLGASSAKYSTAKTVGSTVEFGGIKDVSSTVPVSGSMFLTSLAGMKGTLEVDALALKASPTASEVFSKIAEQIGEISVTEQKGVADGTENTITLVQSTSDELRATVTNGGPGVGDQLHFYKDLRMIWSYADGRLRLCPLSFTRTFLTASALPDHADTAGISAADATAFLALDPFSGSAGQHTLPANRFTFFETWEYGFGAAFTHTASTTRETDRQTTHREYTTESSGWDAGPLLTALGFGGSDTTTVTITNAVGEKVSSTVTLEANLVSGPQDLFVVNIWYDNLFGTFAFESVPVPAGPTVKFQGTGTGPAQEVSLSAGGKVFRTVTGPDGRFEFRAPHIPSGNAMLRVGGVTRPVTI